MLQPNPLKSRDAAQDWFNVPVNRIGAYVDELRSSVTDCLNVGALLDLKEEIPLAIASLTRSCAEVEKTIKNPASIKEGTLDAKWQIIFVGHWQKIDDLIFKLEKLLPEVDARIASLRL